MRLPADVLQASEARGSGIQRPAPLVPHGPRDTSARRDRGALARGTRAGAIRVAEDRAAHLSFGGARPSATELERIIGDANDLVDEFYLERALVAARPVCRLVVRDARQRELGYATGFLVAPRLVLTNWHVFRDRDEAEQGLAEFNYTFDVRGEPVPSTVFRLRPDLFYLSNRDLDFALVVVDTNSTTGTVSLDRYGYHRLVADPAKIRTGEWVTIIQHPGGRRRQFAIRENQLIKKDDPNFLWYASDTAQGSSGSPAFNDQFQVVALHHSGKARRDGDRFVLLDGRRVDSLEGLDDAEVDWEANEGLRVSSLCRFLDAELPAGEFRDEYLESTKGGDIITRVLTGVQSTGVQSTGVQSTRVQNTGVQSTAEGRGGGITIQNAVIHHLIVGAGAAPAIITGSQAAPAARVAIPGGSAFYERTIEPIVDTDYGNRKGYIDDLLGIRVPLPKVIDPGVVSRMDTGECVLPYQHFSVVMHKTRRLALFTASNVTALKRLKEPEPDQDYTRRGLGGFGEDDTERWLTDPRIPELHQLPDTFYNRDRKSFDKGHIVRREDVCWGTTYAEVRRANGDTYHTTNCSPQVKAFNRPSAGGVWGKLENYILTQAKSESYAVFAGPVFAEDDEWFEGVDKRGPIRVQIPRAYWKVIVARGERGLETFAFLLTQDLSSVVMEDEFSVSASWAEHVVPVDELQGQLQGLKFATAIRRADQSQTMPV